MDNNENLKWYAAFVETGCEDKVKIRLEYRLHDKLFFYVPKRKLRERKGGVWHDKCHTLFPGYVLINGIIQPDNLSCFKNIPNLWKILSNNGQPLTILPSEIKFINSLMADGEEIGPSSLFYEGGQIKIIDGPLKGFEGRILKIDRRKGRAKVKMSFLGEERVIELSVNVIANV